MNKMKLLLLTLAFGLFLTNLQATPLCTLNTNLAALRAQAQGCDYAGVNFSSWSYSIRYNGSATNSDPNPTDVLVSFVTLPNHIVSVEFSVNNSSWSLTGTATTPTTADIRPGYLVQSLAPNDPNAVPHLTGISGVGEGAQALVTWDYPIGTTVRNQSSFRAHGGIADNITPLPTGSQTNPSLDIGISPNPGPNGPSTGNPTSLCIVSTTTAGGQTPSTCALNPANIGIVPFGSLAQGMIDGPKDISLTSGKGTNNEFVLVALDENFQEVITPEPATYLLFGAGLVAVGFATRKNLRQPKGTR